MSEYENKRYGCADCGSSDGLALHANGSAYCHACEPAIAYKTSDWVSNNELSVADKPRVKSTMTINTREPRSFPDRGLLGPASSKFHLGFNGDNVVFPYTDETGKEIAWKVRGPDKSFVSYGEMTKSQLFGQNLWPKGGRYVLLVEGEFDALAAWQMLGDWPVVSIKNGANGALKDCKKEYNWLDSFENIVICFDNDEPGKRAAQQVAELFTGKAKVFKHADGFKDACDYSAKPAYEKFKQLFWKAEQFVPEGIIAAATLWDEVNKPVRPADFMYPWPGLNDLTYGCRYQELVTVTAGSGLGKSQFMRELAWSFIQNTEDNMGLMFLEEHYTKTALSVMSMSASVPLHLPTTESTEAERKDAFDATLGTGRVYLLDSFGSTTVDNIVGRVRYMAKALDCRIVLLDHISIVVSAQQHGDERKALDEIMTKLRMLVQETRIALFVVSHLKRPEKKGHEEGAATSLSQLRGSGSIAQLSDMVIGLERNGQADDISERNTTHVRVLKNRFSGETGKACSLFYCKETGRMTEVNSEEAL